MDVGTSFAIRVFAFIAPFLVTRMSRHFTLLPDLGVQADAERLSARRLECVERALAGRPADLIHGLPGALVEAALRGIQAHEGSVWLTTDGGRTLMPAWNNGPDAEKFVGSFHLPVALGFTGMVFCTNMAACESEVCFQQQQHRKLDENLGVLTWALLAAPLRFAGEVRGVITAVRLIRRSDLPADLSQVHSRADLPADLLCPPSFAVADLAAIELTAGALGRLIDHRLTCWAAGWEE